MSTPAADPVPFFPARVQVRRVVRLSPSYVRLVLTGERAAEVADNRYDQRIKLVLPGAGLAGLEHRAGDWYAAWRSLPDADRPPMRTYTIREVRAAQGEFDVDVALHGEVGPGSTWATRAVPGDEIVAVLPHASWDGQHGGIDWTAPPEVGTVLLAGDETAAPAIAGILERLPAGARGLAVVELPHEDDAVVIGERPAGVELVVLPRGEAPVGQRLVAEVVARAGGLIAAAHADDVAEAGALEDVDVDQGLLWEVPSPQDQARALHPGTFAAWFAGEAGAIKTLRRHLVSELGVDRRLVAFMGYWRQGRAETNL